MSIMPTEREAVLELIADLRAQASLAETEDEVREITARIADITRRYRIAHGIGIPTNPVQQALELDDRYVVRDHIEHLGTVLADAVREVERGRNQQIIVTMPPRAGKSQLISLYNPLWILRRHPEWSIVTASYDATLTGGWARSIRRLIEDRPDLGVALQKDGGSGYQYETLEGGGLFSTSVRGALTGRGARVMIIDDPVKDFVEAHSPAMRESLWRWYLSVATTRLEPPYLVLIVMTRWHEDDLVGRLLSKDYEGDPRDWQHVLLPAIAESNDRLGRPEGAPLISPLLEETPEMAIARWDQVRSTVGTYTFAAMYQQRPAPQKGAIFDTGWWRFWTLDPTKATEDGKVVHLDPSSLAGALWLDSWDLNFESDENTVGGWVVGQRWVRHGARRYLIAQQRGRWTFTQSLAAMRRWIDPNSYCGTFVHRRLVEKKANGAAMLDVLKEEVAGLKPINPTTSKENRARAITPEVESGHVYLPHPSDPGNEWVADLLSELRTFPHDVADDQVDALTQALSELRDPGTGNISVPRGSRIPTTRAAAAQSALQRGRSGYHR